MKYYAIGDIHGRFDLVKKAQESIKLHGGDSEYKVVFLGDYIDRGPQSRQVIEHLMEAQRLDPTVICLQGNHEAIMIESITTPLSPDWWVSNGGDTTLKSYGWGGEPYSTWAYDVVPKTHIDWLSSLPVHYEADKQVFVHAGIPQWNMNLPPSSKQKHKQKRLIEQMQWMLYDKADSGGWKSKHVVHGHHQFADGPHVWHGNKGGRTDLDTWAYHTGRLVIGVFDDSRGPAVDFIEVTCMKNGS